MRERAGGFRLLHALLVVLALLGVLPGKAQVVSFPGSTAVGRTGVAEPVTVAISASGSLGNIDVRTLGSDGFDFVNSGGGSCLSGASYAAGQTCTVMVSFHPLAPGDRRGAVVLRDAGGRQLGLQLLDGLATGPVGTFVPGAMTTVAGDALWIYAGDGAPATQSPIFLPFGIAVDAAGNLYIVDSNNDRVRKVSVSTGNISTIAGTGILGFTGDGGPAIAATLSTPTSVALDPAGNVYFTDSGNNAVRRIDAVTGVLTTVAGTLGSQGYTGDGGAATAATLNGPNGLGFDLAGDLYIVDTGNNVVRMVSAGTGLISTVAGNGHASYTGDGGAATAATLNGPRSLTVTAAGILYIADQNNNVIRMMNAQGVISTVVGTSTAGFAGDGAAANAAQLDSPAGVVLDAAGNLYVADSGNNRVRKVSAATGLITTIAGTNTESIVGDGGPATAAGLYGPYGLALDGQGSLYIADVFHNRIRKVSANTATLIYPAIRAGRVSAPMTQTFENDGNASLTPASITAVTNAQVDAASTTCAAADILPVLGQCVVGADFAPTNLGALVTGSIDVHSDAQNSPGVLTLEGEVLDLDPTTVTLTSSVNPSITGTPVLFTVTASSAGTTPTGAVTLLDGTSILGTASLVSGTVTFNIGSLAAGTHTITASYAGDTSNTAGVSAPLTQLVKDLQASTTTTISSGSNPTVAGASLKLTALIAVSVAGSGNGVITGSVTFYDGAAPLGAGSILNGVASIRVTTLSVGAHSLKAVYGGDTNYSASTSSAIAESVTLATSMTVLSSGANPATAGGSLTLTATVLTTGGVATGAATFYDGTTKIGSAPLNASGVAAVTLSGSLWTVGTHTLTAIYAGDAQDATSTSPIYAQVFKLATTSTAVTSSATPIGLGGSVTFSASVSGHGGIPTGAVNFYDGATLLGSGTLNAAGVATYSTSTLALGMHTVSAAYAGDPYNAASTSTNLTEAVQSDSTSVVLVASKNPSLFGQSLTLSATVSGTGSVPTGSITFLDGGAAMGSAPLNASGVASISTTTLAIGAHTLTASYTGDTNHSATLSASVSENILQGTSTALTESTTQSIAGSPVSWNVTVTGSASKAVGGSIALMDGGSLLQTLTLNSVGVGSFTASVLKPGTHSITAAYAGDATDAASTSSAAVLVVTIATTSTTLSTSANPALSGSAVTFIAAVSGNGGLPTGSMTFVDGATPLSTVAVTPGAGTQTASATLMLSTLAPGLHAITARYNGDSNDNISVSPAVSQQIFEQTSLSLVSSANPSLLTDAVTFTVVATNGSATAPPHGSVTLTDNGAAAGTATLNASGSASFTLSSLALGTHQMVATYAGDTIDAPATPATLTQVVELRPTSTSLTPSSTDLAAGQPLLLLSVVQGAGSRMPTGTVTFASGATVLGTATLGAQGVATLSVQPAQGSYNLVSTYSGDSLFAASTSAPVALTVGPTVEFTLTATPSSISMQSGQHGTLSLAVITAANLTDTLSFGCAGLPASATCTFSQDQMAVSGGVAKTLAVTVDTGNPLGSGGVASSEGAHSTAILACMLPAGALLLLLGRKARLRAPLGVLTLLLLLAAMTTLSGCGNHLQVNDTPAGTYTFQVVGIGLKSGATQAAAVQLTVTQ